MFVTLNAVSISSTCIKAGLAAYGRLDLCCWPRHVHVECQSEASLEMASFKVEGRSDIETFLEACLKPKI